MEKLKFKYQNRPEFKQGLKDFKESKIKNEGKKAMWLRAKITQKEWINNYSKIPGYTLLEKEKDGVWIGSYGIGVNLKATQIVNLEDLRKIQLHREAINWRPKPMEKKH